MRFVETGIREFLKAGLAAFLYVISPNAPADVWRVQYHDIYRDSSESLYDLSESTDGGVVAVGTTTAVDEAGKDAFVFKLDRAGQVVWQRAIGGNADDIGIVVQRTRRGTHIVAGDTKSYGAVQPDYYAERLEIFVFEIDANGSVLWQKTYGTVFADNEQPDTVSDLVVTGDDGLLLVGQSNDIDGRRLAFAMRLSNDGVIQWQQRFLLNDGSYSYLSRGIGTTDGGYALIGSHEGAADPFVIKLASNGAVEWFRSYEDPYEGVYQNSDSPRALIQTNDGGYLLALATEVDESDYMDDVALLKLSADGEIIWQYLYGHPGYQDRANDTPVDLFETNDGYLVGLTAANDETAILEVTKDTGHVVNYRLPSGGKYLDRLRRTADGGFLLGGSYIQKVNANVGYAGSACATYERSIDRRLAEYFIDDEVSIGTVSSALQSVAREMPVSVLDLEVFRNCYQPDGIDLQIAVTGQGLVSSEPYGISCGNRCSADFIPGTTVTLEATPAFGEVFDGWGGACQGTDPNCVVNVDSAKSVTAVFRSIPVHGNTWRIKYHDIYRDSSESVNDIAATFDGGLVAAGSTRPNDDADGLDAFVFKLDQDGQMTWQRAIGEPHQDWAAVIRETPARTYVVAGTTKSFGDDEPTYLATREEIFVNEIAFNGDVLWQKTYGTVFFDDERSDTINDLVVTDDGGYLLVGMSEDSDGRRDAFAMRLASHGDIVWQQRFRLSDDAYSYLTRGIQTRDGGYALVGSHEGAADPFLIKLSSDGSQQWFRYFEDPLEGVYQDSDYPTSLLQTSDGGFLLGLDAEVDEWDYMHEVVLLKLSASGDIEWQYLYGNQGYQSFANDSPADLLEEADGFVVGLSAAGNVSSIMRVSKGNGAILRQIRQANGKDVQRLVRMADGGYAIGGTYILKLDQAYTYACDPGDSDCVGCETYAGAMERRSAAYFIDGTITINASASHLRARTRDMDVESRNLENWRSCAGQAIDTDGDGLQDEVDSDDDGDGMPDTYEVFYRFDPLDADDATHDADGDGDSNLAEYRQRTDPRDPASNRDALVKRLVPVILSILLSE